METTIVTRPAPAAAPHAVIRRILAGKAVWLVAAAAFGVEMALSARYGYVRDELYFLAAGAHPALGYVDQPLLTPLLAHLDALLTGNTLVGLRALPALAFAAMVVLTGSIARQTRRQPARPAAGRDRDRLLRRVPGRDARAHHHRAGLPVWTVLLWLVTRLLTSGDPRWWLAIGATAGIGDDREVEHRLPRRGAAARLRLHAGRAAAAAQPAPGPRRGALRGARRARLRLAGGARLAEPRGLPARCRATRGRTASQYWPGQVLYTSILLVPLWVGGIRWALREPRFRAASASPRCS